MEHMVNLTTATTLKAELDKTNKNVAKFVKFIATKKARAIFKKYGFQLPAEK